LPPAAETTQIRALDQPARAGTGAVLALYQQKCDSGDVVADAAQKPALHALDALCAALAAAPPPKRWFWQKATPAPLGLYIWGPVGRGKSLLMDLFMEVVPVAEKRRVHFHAFMLEVHSRIHAWRQEQAGDPIPAVASAIATETRLLCFDEFQVTDIADAMILGRLFTALFGAGVVMVATSNTPPERLYENGLQRALFMPFIALLQSRTQTVSVDGAKDYRRDRLQGQDTYHTPLTPESFAALRREFDTLTDGASGAPDKLEFLGRSLNVPRAAHGVAWFTFDQLCREALGAADFEALAKAYSTLILEAIPVIPAEERNTARRFVVLIDTLYEHKTKLICTAQTQPEWIYPAGDLVREFERTVSRLYEMQSDEYWDLPSHGAHK